MANGTPGSGSSRLRSRGVFVVALTALLLVIGGGVAGGLAFATIGQDDKDEFLNDVANRLGVSRADLDQAIEGAGKARIDAFEEDGRLSPEQADRLRDAIESGRTPFFGGKGPGFHRHGPGILRAVLDTLGVPLDQLPERLAGSSIAAIAEEQDVPLEDVKEPILERVRAKLDEKVTAERITLEQRQEMLERLNSHLDQLLNRVWPESLSDLPGRFGFHWGKGDAERPPGASVEDPALAG